MHDFQQLNESQLQAVEGGHGGNAFADGVVAVLHAIAGPFVHPIALGFEAIGLFEIADFFHSLHGH